MHIWIDIDNPRPVPFLKAIINELKERGVTVTTTAQNSNPIKTALIENNLNAKVTGYIFSLFGLFLEQMNLIRTVFLLNYIKNRNIDAAFSFGSKPVLYACINRNIPLILFLDNYEQKPHHLHFALEKSFFIISENIQEQKLIEKGYDLKKIARYKGSIQKEDLNPDLKVIKEITDKIEFLCKHIPGGVVA